MPRRVDLYRIPMQGPGDVAGLQRLLEAGAFAAGEIVAILGKTEGNGGVNDFTREYASASFCRLLAPRLGCTPADVEHRVALVMSGGTEGVLSPHASVFVRREVAGPAAPGPRLAIGVAQTRAFLPEELGRAAQVEETARAVRAALADAGIASNADVHFVQVKCPLLTAERMRQAQQRGAATATGDAYKSMACSRGASALGVGLALEEIAGPVRDADVLADWRLQSGVASTSAGIELAHSVVVVMGNAAGVAGELVIGHAVMQDAIDLQAALQAFESVGLRDAQARLQRTVNVFAKAESAPDGAVRGHRHTMLDDTDISATRHARAAVGGLLAGVAGHGGIYVSGGAEHQGPPGGGPVAVVARVA